MYCNRCHRDQQPIHLTINEKFHAFIKGNRKWIDLIRDGEIITLPELEEVRGQIARFKLFPKRKQSFTIYNNDLLGDPYNVHYVGNRRYGEGSMIEFMDGNMDKLFSYYDVE